MTVPADLRELPKCELHVHLEGAVRPATLEAMAAREGVGVARVFADLPSFVDVYMAATRVMTRPGDYARLVNEYCEDAVRNGVRYAELEVSPALGNHTFHAFHEAAEAASKQRDVIVRFTVGLGRVLPVEIKWRMLAGLQDVPGIVALGLGGPEEGYPAAPFADVFAEAKRRGWRSAPHAGENDGPASVREVIDELGAERIQHGVRSIEDPALVALLAERGIGLAVCPTSNLLLGVVSSLDEHPLRQLWDAGVVVSVNTDDPGFFGCDLTGEYEIAGRLLRLDRAGYARLARNSVESSFAPEPVKSELRAAIDAWSARR